MERLRVSEQKWARVRRAVHGGGRRVPPDTPCSSRPPPCTWSTAAAAEPAQRGTRRFRTQSRRALHCHTRARLRRPRAWRRRQSFWASQGLAPPPAPQAEAKGFSSHVVLAAPASGATAARQTMSLIFVTVQFFFKTPRAAFCRRQRCRELPAC